MFGTAAPLPGPTGTAAGSRRLRDAPRRPGGGRRVGPRHLAGQHAAVDHTRGGVSGVDRDGADPGSPDPPRRAELPGRCPPAGVPPDPLAPLEAVLDPAGPRSAPPVAVREKPIALPVVRCPGGW